MTMCGPIALAAVAGRSVEEIMPLCEAAGFSDGMTYDQILVVAAQLGVSSVEVEFEAPRALWKVWEDLKLWPYQRAEAPLASFLFFTSTHVVGWAPGVGSINGTHLEAPVIYVLRLEEQGP